jgi:uncharacterized membrane protein
MNTENIVRIDAPAPLVWEIFSDVERWPQWTSSVTGLVGLDGPTLAVGKRFEIKQPRMPRLVWKVTELSPGASWTWVQRSVGNTTVARHQVIPTNDGRTVVRQRIEQQGPLGRAIGLIMIRMTRRYLELEAAGLKSRSEKPRNLDGPHS